MGFGVSELGFWVLGFRNQDLGFRVWVWGSRFGFRVWGLGFLFSPPGLLTAQTKQKDYRLYPTRFRV